MFWKPLVSVRCIQLLSGFLDLALIKTEKNEKKKECVNYEKTIAYTQIQRP